MNDVSSGTTETVRVDIQSAWASKINWTQVVAGLAMILSFVSGGKIGMTVEQQLALVTVIGVLSNVITWIIRTWFTKSVTPASVTGVPGGLPKVVVLLPLLILGGPLLGGCQLSDITKFVSNATSLLPVASASVTNPVTPARFDKLEKAATLATSGLNIYKRECVAGHLNEGCIATIRDIQVYTRKIAAALPELRRFVRSGDQINAIRLFNEIVALYENARSAAPDGVIPAASDQ